MTKRIQSVQRATAICHYIAGHPETSLKTLQDVFQLPKTTLFGILATLTADEILYKNPQTTAYSLGRAALALADALPADQLLALLQPELIHLATDLNLAVHVAVRRGDVAHYLAKIEAPHPQHVSAAPGTDDPLATTAAGKLLLSATTTDFQHHYLTTVSAPAAQRFRTELPGIMAHNVAYDHGEQATHIGCVAVGLRNHRNQLLASLSIVAPGDATALATGETALLDLVARLKERL
ncbi:IclR family transcriptional regulator [Levilactobacillus fujinensis]|uniref:IclR family transcriptional regulator n=1 Tax=Levilactobacillus fujinensis TaxID=2486024 RepID=A0ABW1TGQ2_9LACO|nr:IclR family transcriptional regulator C-terminal domain-containing protein [Levilactobacillus fujinensis]